MEVGAQIGADEARQPPLPKLRDMYLLMTQELVEGARSHGDRSPDDHPGAECDRVRTARYGPTDPEQVALWTDPPEQFGIVARGSDTKDCPLGQHENRLGTYWLPNKAERQAFAAFR